MLATQSPCSSRNSYNAKLGHCFATFIALLTIRSGQFMAAGADLYAQSRSLKLEQKTTTHRFTWNETTERSGHPLHANTSNTQAAGIRFTHETALYDNNTSDLYKRESFSSSATAVGDQRRQRLAPSLYGYTVQSDQLRSVPKDR